MRKLIVSSIAAVLLMASSVGAPAGPAAVTSENVEHISTIPFDAGLATGARLVGKYLYVAGAKSFSIYDVSNPLDPQLQSLTPIGFQFANEDVDTNGEILLLADDAGRKQLHVWNVEDKTKPVEVSVVDGMNDHTFSCVFDCRYAYGSRGHIVDLRDPTAPKAIKGWAPGTGPGDGFDVTEVSPGMVLTATRNIQLLDARDNPMAPKTVAMGGTDDWRLIHSVSWPDKGRSRYFLVQGETPFSGVCDDESGAFMTWDSKNWRKTHAFRMVDEYRVSNGTFTDGNPPAGVAGCTAMWHQAHPQYRKTGLVASAFFEHGVRFLDVDKRGKISEVGYFMPVGGATIASYWITDEVVYAIDFERGIDILRLKR